MNRSIHLRLYRMLLAVLPAGFRRRYGGHLQETFAELITESRSHARSVWRVWAGALGDLLRTGLLNRRSLSVSPRARNTPPLTPRIRDTIVNALRQDFAYALRLLARRPGFVAVTAITLGLGIGSVTAVFSVVDGILLRPLPFDEPDRLVSAWSRFLPESGIDMPRLAVSPEEYLDLLAASETLSEVASYRTTAVTITTGDGPPERVTTGLVSWNLFPLLRVTPTYGRGFLPADDQPDSDVVVVLGHGLWQRRFGADLEIVGRTIELNGDAAEVVGVMPPGFAFPVDETRLWLAERLDPTLPFLRLSHYFNVVGRLSPTTTLEQAHAEVDAINTEWRNRMPDHHTGHFIWLRPYLDDVVSDVRPALLLVLIASGFVVLIACTNVANLMMVRGDEQRRDIALRRALGAGRWQLARHLLVQSAVVAALGGFVGVTVAAVGVGVLRVQATRVVPRLDNVTVDDRALLVAGAVTVVTVLLFGLLPAIRASAAQHHLGVGASRTMTTGRRPLRWRHALVIAQTALCVVLVIGTGLTVKSLATLLRVDPGFEPNGVLTLRVSLPSARYSGQETVGFYSALLEDVRALPGVISASAATRVPLHGRARGLSDFKIEGRERTPVGDQGWNAEIVTVRPDYFRALRIPLLRGRAFSYADREDAEPVAIISESMARVYWRNEDPLGKRMALNGPGAPWATVVGVVGDVRSASLETAPEPIYYFSNAQRWSRSLTLVVRTTGDPHVHAAAVARAIHGRDPALAVEAVRTMDELVGDTLQRRRLTVLSMGLFALMALVLGAVGVYGVIAYTVSQRIREIGLRIALGAVRPQLLARVVMGGVGLALTGAAIGFSVALIGAGTISAMLYQVNPRDPFVFAAVPLLFVGLGALAAYLPARRATRVSPMVIMRSE